MFRGKRDGYDMNLYRSPNNNWIAGVCGGIAENTGWPGWLVRLAAFMLFSITGVFAVLAYIVAVFMLQKREIPLEGSAANAKQYSRYSHRQPVNRNLKDAVFNYHEAPGQQAKALHHRMKMLDGKLRKMETYVTSKRFQFDQELKRS